MKINRTKATWRRFNRDRKFHFAWSSETSRFDDAQDTACGWRCCVSYFEEREGHEPPKKLKCAPCLRALALASKEAS